MDISNNQKMCLMPTPQTMLRDVITKLLFLTDVIPKHKII